MMEGIESLSPKQREVMELVVKGLKTDAIASSLGCSPETVKDHLSEIYRRLGVSGRVEAVVVWLNEAR